nr:reverse transcriptase domain-containing protein [Tanacetum cinerariifolium]
MHTRSSSKLSRGQTSNPTSSTNPSPKGRIHRSSKQKVENSNFEENPLPPEVPMADNRTMAQLLQAPTEGYEDAIVIPKIEATNFELKHGLINLVQNKQFLGHDKEDPHAHIRYFNKITSTMRVPNVNQPLAYQAPSYQAPVSQTQSVSQTDFERYIKANDAVLRNIQSQGQRMDECLALADLGVSINLMPLSVWKGLSLPKLTPTCMTLELADRTESKPISIAKDVKVKTGRALIDVHKGELTLRIGNEAITYNLDQTSRYSANYDQMTANKIDVTDEACEEYSQEVL